MGQWHNSSLGPMVVTQIECAEGMVLSALGQPSQLWAAGSTELVTNVSVIYKYCHFIAMEKKIAGSIDSVGETFRDARLKD